MKFFVTSKISENICETPEGFLVCLGVPVARTGVQVYGEGETPLETKDGEVEVYRAEEEVFRPETIASFSGKPITISHPTEFVNPQNWSVLSKGVLQNPRRGQGEHKDDLLADLLITDSMAIGLIKNGLREVSCGYEADYEQTEIGKGVQKKIIGNHLALVDQGRAGSRYAIKDHKGEGKIMKLKDRIKSIFAKAEDDAKAVFSKAQDEAMKSISGDDKEEKKDDKKAGDEEKPSYDALMERVSDLEQQIKVLSGDEEKKDDEKVDDEEGKEAEILSRINALEAAMKKLAGAGDEKKDDDEEAKDEEKKDDEESEDDDMEESTMVGDSDVVSRAEILSPGIEITKDVKAKALKAAYSTKTGKKVIDSLTGGKPTFDSAEKVDMLFIAASEVLKQSRTEEFLKTRKTKDDNGSGNADEGVMTPEKLNEINEKHYKRQA